MTRDWDLMGDIFNSIEDETFERTYLRIKDQEEQKKVLWHIEMLVDAGYLKGITITYGSMGTPLVKCQFPRITLQGYDFADIVKDKYLLPRVQKAIKEAGLEITWETLKAFAPKVVMTLAASAAKAVGF